MMRRISILVTAACIVLVTGITSARSEDNEATLKKRFEERYPTLIRLKDAGKVGETATGFGDAVDERYLAEKVDADHPDGDTIRAFLKHENTDRKKLYILIARRSSASPEEVARRNARRLFDKADPDHYLRLPSGRWVQKKDLTNEKDEMSRP